MLGPVGTLADMQEGWGREDEVLFNALWPSTSLGDGALQGGPCLLVANKRDLVAAVNLGRLPLYCHKRFDAILAVSATQGTNLDKLEDALERVALGGNVATGGRTWAVNDRQADALVRAHASLLKVSESVEAGVPLDFWTIDMRDALYALGSVTGDAVTEEILDTVFSKFCIGK
jgi:tRNA modification GTPase